MYLCQHSQGDVLDLPDLIVGLLHRHTDEVLVVVKVSRRHVQVSLRRMDVSWRADRQHVTDFARENEFADLKELVFDYLGDLVTLVGHEDTTLRLALIKTTIGVPDNTFLVRLWGVNLLLNFDHFYF